VQGLIVLVRPVIPPSKESSEAAVTVIPFLTGEGKTGSFLVPSHERSKRNAVSISWVSMAMTNNIFF